MIVAKRTKSIEPLVRPASVAVIGASPDLSRYPGKIVENLRRFNFQGRVYGVNPKYQEVMGYPCYPDVSAIPEPADVALILMGARGVPAALESAARAGCRSAIVFASGMAEAGPAGAALQREVRRIADGAGIPVLGPNGLGLLNAVDGIVLGGAAAFQRGELVPGRIGLAAQSGGLMGSILDRAWVERIGFSYAFSTGNEADLTLADCLEFMVADPTTQVIALLAETIRDVPTFRAACERAAELGKAVVVLKVGRSERGKRAALTHTAALAGNDAAYDALFDRLGVLRVGDLDELFTVPNVLVNTPFPRGRNLAIASTAGGLAGLSADKCEEYAVPLADLSAETLDALQPMLEGFGTADNPLDMTGQIISKETWWMMRRILELLLADPGADVLVFGQPTSQYAEAAAEDVVAIAATATKPLVVLWTGRYAIASALATLREAHVPVFEQPDLCYRSIRRVFQLVRFREKRARAQSVVPPAIDERRRAAALRLCQAAPGGMSEHESKQLLALYGIPVPEERVVGSAEEAVAAAERIGYPVAVKAHSRELRHKSERDAVRLDVADAAAVAAAFTAVTGGGGTTEALVSRMAPAGTELILGLTRDPQMGLLLLVGLGGIFVEVFKDAALAMPPLWPGEAEELLARLRGAALLEGVRGRPPIDKPSAIAAIEALSTLAVEIGDAIEQIDVNPLIVGPAGSGAYAVDALVIPR